MTERAGIRWVASYPKSGNTFLRLLLEAYCKNGWVDINDMTLTHGDSGATLIQGVSPTPVNELGLRGETLLRPAALVGLYCRMTPPVYIKTHWCNLQLDRCSPGIPPDLTEKAVYVVRDPRDVFSSFSRFFGFSAEKTVDAMSSDEFTIGGQPEYSRTWVSSWTNHVASWVGEKDFPVHVVRYEDLLAEPEKELTEVLEFFGYEVDQERVKRSVDAAALTKIKEQEEKNGFREYSGKQNRFFGSGGSRYLSEVGKKWIDKIEEDHGKVMSSLGYLEQNLLHVVEK